MLQASAVNILQSCYGVLLSEDGSFTMVPIHVEVPVPPGPLTSTFWQLEHACARGSWIDLFCALQGVQEVVRAYGHDASARACDEALDACFCWSEHKLRRVCRDVSSLFMALCLHAIPNVLAAHMHRPEAHYAPPAVSM